MNNVFGMRSGYTCCLANMHQGWTKFAANLWHKTNDNGLAALVYAPNEIRTRAGKNDTEITIREETSYPFEDTIRFIISTENTVEFSLHLRIPEWCDEAVLSINGAQQNITGSDRIVQIRRPWKEGDTLHLTLPMKVRIAECGRNARAIERGPLVYALKLEEQWEKGHDEKEGDYYSVYPIEDWNYGLLKQIVDNPPENLKVTGVQKAGDDFVWNIKHAPVEISVKAKKIPGWGIMNGVAPSPVTDRTGVFRGEVADEEETITLIPYGCTKVRVVAFPVVE